MMNVRQLTRNLRFVHSNNEKIQSSEVSSKPRIYWLKCRFFPVKSEENPKYFFCSDNVETNVKFS
jgi:hypothetical protein